MLYFDLHVSNNDSCLLSHTKRGGGIDMSENALKARLMGSTGFYSFWHAVQFILEFTHIG